ncbi:MAG TPA: hypothetical protein DEP57_07235, partial [Selenomonas sp.]|nr:hypothetical protein [Selenomonas sp.]
IAAMIRIELFIPQHALKFWHFQAHQINVAAYLYSPFHSDLNYVPQCHPHSMPIAPYSLTLADEGNGKVLRYV